MGLGKLCSIQASRDGLFVEAASFIGFCKLCSNSVPHETWPFASRLRYSLAYVSLQYSCASQDLLFLLVSEKALIRSSTVAYGFRVGGHPVDPTADFQIKQLSGAHRLRQTSALRWFSRTISNDTSISRRPDTAVCLCLTFSYRSVCKYVCLWMVYKIFSGTGPTVLGQQYDSSWQACCTWF